MDKWKRLLQEAQAAAKAARQIVAKAETAGREMTEAERVEYQAKFDEATLKKSQSDQAKTDQESEELLAELSGDDGDAPDDAGDEGDDQEGEPRRPVGKAYTQPRGVDFGTRFIKSDAYKAFQRQYPTGVGSGSPVSIGRVKLGTMKEWAAQRKATLTSGLGLVQDVRMPTVDLVDRNRLTLLDLISRGQTSGNFEYVQVTAVTRNAAIVPEATGPSDSAALKPLSDMTTTLADAKVFTYADGYDVTNALLADAPAFASYMENELSYSLDNVVEDKLLNGSGVSGNPTGILATSGVQSVDYTAAAVGADGLPTDVTAKAFIRAARIAILNLVRLPGGTVQAVLLSPEMDAAIDLIQDAQERYYGNGPFGQGPGTLWGRPRVVSERLVDTTGLLGDFRQVALLDREGLSVLAFNQHKDYAQRNMTYVRAELRAAQVIWKPSRLAVVAAV